jgi:hypothetical protein
LAGLAHRRRVHTRVWQALRSLIGELGETAERRILSETAQTFYGIPQARLDVAAQVGRLVP